MKLPLHRGESVPALAKEPEKRMPESASSAGPGPPERTTCRKVQRDAVVSGSCASNKSPESKRREDCLPVEAGATGSVGIDFGIVCDTMEKFRSSSNSERSADKTPAALRLFTKTGPLLSR